MSPWNTAGRRALISGTVASLASAAVLAIRGRHEGTTAAGPNNGPSQWVHGRHAAHRRGSSLRYTLVGYLIHHLSATGWALLHERYLGTVGAPRSFGADLARAALTATAAKVVDFRVAPRRLQPGFDVQLSRASLLLVYAAFGLGLAAGSRLARRDRGQAT